MVKESLERLTQRQLNWAVIRFPGTWSDYDCDFALRELLGQKSEIIWSKNRVSLDEFDAIILPGGFSYGDYLRTGAIARFDPIMMEIEKAATDGKPIIGICNGFQILTEAGFLPGVLMRNEDLKYHCQNVHLRVEKIDSLFTNRCQKFQVLKMPISHGEGRFWCDEETLQSLKNNNQILFRYCCKNGEIREDFNPNGSVDNIAGIINKQGNILGMMPHPERACEILLGGIDGQFIFNSIIRTTIKGNSIK